MEDLIANRVRTLRPSIVVKIRPEDVGQKLWVLNCVSKKEKDRLLREQRTHGDKAHNSLLLDILLRKPANQCVLEKFVRVLEDTANVTVGHLIQHDLCDEALLSKLDKNKLQKRHYDYISGMEMSSVLRTLVEKENYLSFIEKEDLQSLKTNKDKAEYLMANVISKGTYGHLKLLKRVLLESGQSVLASYLPIEGPGAADQSDHGHDETDSLGEHREMLAKGHTLQYSENVADQSLLMNQEPPLTSGRADSGYPQSRSDDSGVEGSRGFLSNVQNKTGDTQTGNLESSQTYDTGYDTRDRKPNDDEIATARDVIFNIIENKEFTPYDFYINLIKFKKMNYITPVNLVSSEGLNILQACIDQGRLSLLIHIIHIGWWKILSGQKLPEDSTSEHKGKTAKQIAESKKARKPLDEFNTHNEWEGSLSPLMRACRHGDLTRAKNQLETSAMETYHSDYNSGNAIYWAVVNGNLKLVQYLEKEGLSIKMQTKKKETLLHMACSLGHSNLIECLVKDYKIDHTIIDTNHKMALDRVSENGDIETLTEFVKCGIQPKPNAPALAGFAGRTDFLAHLFGSLNVPVDSLDMYSRTALHRSCEGGKVATVKYLLGRGADVTLVTSMGRNILHIIADSGNMELLTTVIPILKVKDVFFNQLNAQDRYNGVDLCFLIRGRDKGRDAYHYVEVERNQVPIFLKKTKCGNVDVAKFGIVIKSGWGVNPDQDAVDEIEELFKRRRLNQKAEKDQTPLHIAIAKGNFEIAKCLMDHGADINIPDKFGLTPILLATSKGHLETVTLLENRGADFSHRDRKGFGIKEIADQNEHEHLVNYDEGREYEKSITSLLKGLDLVEETLLQTRRMQEEKKDVKVEVTDTMRGLSSKVNAALKTLGSGPVTKESVGYSSMMLVPCHIRDKVTMMVTSDAGKISAMSTGSSDSGFFSDPGSSIESWRESALKHESLLEEGSNFPFNALIRA